MKTQVYTWRLSRELKSELERRARVRKQSIGKILEEATRDWLKRNRKNESDEETQQALQE